MRAMFLKLRRRLGASEEKIRNFARLVALALRRSSGVTESPTPARSGNQPVLGEYYKGGVSFLSFNRASQRSGSGAAELPSAEASFLFWELKKVGSGATLEEIGWTPIPCAAGFGLN